jgi:type IV secretory pathway TraG/TraD family ATPase VirD4
VAPTRSGKGVGLVVPTLLTWTGSAVIHDIKDENWQLTAGWRSRFSDCLLFDSTNPNSTRFNPLLEVRPGENEVRDVQNIADMLVDGKGAQPRDHREKTAYALRTGAILRVLASTWRHVALHRAVRHREHSQSSTLTITCGVMRNGAAQYWLARDVRPRSGGSRHDDACRRSLALSLAAGPLASYIQNDACVTAVLVAG